MLEFDDIELMQLKFCMDQTKNQMSMGGEIRRHASITEKVEAEMDRRREESGTYTREKILRDLEAQIKSIKEATDLGSRDNFPKRDVMYAVKVIKENAIKGDKELWLGGVPFKFELSSCSTDA